MIHFFQGKGRTPARSPRYREGRWGWDPCIVTQCVTQCDASPRDPTQGQQGQQGQQEREGTAHKGGGGEGGEGGETVGSNGVVIAVDLSDPYDEKLRFSITFTRDGLKKDVKRLNVRYRRL